MSKTKLKVDDRVRFGKVLGTIIRQNIGHGNLEPGYDVRLDSGNIAYNLADENLRRI